MDMLVAATPIPYAGNIATEYPAYGKLTIIQGQTLYEAVPRLINPNGTPYDLTGKSFTLYVIPTPEDTRRITKLFSPASGIRIVDAPGGLIDIYQPQSTVDTWPIGSFWHFMNMSFTDPDYGAVTVTLWRGPCLIYPDQIN